MGVRIGQGYDVHRLADGLPMWLCGVRIDSPKGFVAHSDGDVSDEFKGIDSKILLTRVMDLVRGKGYSVGNADITIALQAPKIGSYVPTMRETLAGLLGVGADCVSVKATTTERLGFVGRGEGCEVWAVCLLQPAG